MGKNQTHKSMQMAKHSRGGGGGGPEDVDPRYAGELGPAGWQGLLWRWAGDETLCKWPVAGSASAGQPLLPATH